MVHLEEYISPIELEKKDAAGMKMKSAGRGIRKRDETEDSFIGKQIAETLGTGHRGPGICGSSTSPGSSSAAHHQMKEEGSSQRIDVMRPKLVNINGRGRKK